MILEGANDLEPGAIANVGKPRIAMAAKVTLKNSPVGRSVEERAPRLELVHARGSFLRMKLRHPPVIHVLPAAHRVGEVHTPVISIVHIAHRGGDAFFGHHRVCLAQQ